MSTLGNNSFGSGDVGQVGSPITLRESMVIDRDAFYNLNEFATTASIKSSRGIEISSVVGIYDRKPSSPELFGQAESYITTFRTPNNQVGVLRHGDELIVCRKSHHVIQVEQDSNGDTILTLSLHEDVSEQAS